MSNSSLVTYKKLTKNKNSPRNHKIDTITIHVWVGQVTAKEGCDYFATTDRQVSSNYVVGFDGSIGLSVEEKDRSWCSSNAANDHRAVTIEVASEPTHPYMITDKAYKALIELVTDICKRNDINQLLWKADKSLIGQIDKQNMTVHRWFAAKTCPGEYLYGKHGEIAAEVNRRLGSGTQKPTSQPKPLNKSVEEIAKEVLIGKWGNGTDRKNRLIKAGYDYNAVQKKVNEIKNKKTEPNPKKSIDEIAKEVIKGKWGNGTDRKNSLIKAGYDYSEVQKRVNQLLKKG